LLTDCVLVKMKAFFGGSRIASGLALGVSLLHVLGGDNDGIFLFAAAEPLVSWEILSYDNFEAAGGSSTWTKEVGAGTNAALVDHHWCSTHRPYAYQGECALRLGDDAETVSAVLSKKLDASAYDSLRLTFWYHATSVDGFWEHFILQVSHDDGATWDTARTWNWNVEFVTREFKQASVVLAAANDAPNSAFTDATQFRLGVGPGSGNSDRLYVDELEIAGLFPIMGVPSTIPSDIPSDIPSATPSSRPSNDPSATPSSRPSNDPSATPSSHPSTSDTPSTSPVDDNTATRENTCPKARVETSTQFTIPALGRITHEVSYLAYSSQTYGEFNHRVMWLGSDGSANSITAVNIDSSVEICEYELSFGTPGSNNWESMSLGPCGSSPTSGICLYLGNMGNNGATGCTAPPCSGGVEVVEIYKLAEPNVNLPCPTTPNDVVTLQVDYKHVDMPTDKADSDAMFVDFTGDTSPGGDGNPGDIYVITKNSANGALARVTKYPVADHETLLPGNNPAPFSVIPVAGTRGFQWEGADMSVNGNLIALRDYDYVFFYPRLGGQTVAQALESEPCDFASASVRGGLNKNNFESVAIMDNNFLAEASECDSNANCAVELVVYGLQTLSSGTPDEVGAWTLISFEDFDDGFGAWSGTVQYTQLYNSDARFYKGTQSAELKYRYGEAMMVMASFFDATPYEQLEFKLEFILDNFDSTSEDFFLEISNNNGVSWTEVREWDYLRGYTNGVWYSESWIIDPILIDFTTAMKFRIRVDASSQNDFLYLDNLVISGRTLLFPDIPDPPVEEGPTYSPGFLRDADANGIKWSRGLSSKLIAAEGENVPLYGGGTSAAMFHTDPDAGACFPLEDGSNGWVYVLNSEDSWSANLPNVGGVGAIYFDSNGNVVDYEWILSQTNDNCGGGKSPWNTWISVSTMTVIQ
jgi:hypothetical protein